MKYAPSTGVFYPDDIAYASLPDDAIETTDAVFAAAMDAPGSTVSLVGSELVVNAPAAPTADEVKAELVVHAANYRDIVAAGGLTVDVGAVGAPATCAVDTSQIGRANLGGLAIAAQADATADFVWVQSSGNITLSAAQIMKLQIAVTTFITAVWTAYGEVAAAIETGTIADVSAINAASWPTNS